MTKIQSLRIKIKGPGLNFVLIEIAGRCGPLRSSFKPGIITSISLAFLERGAKRSGKLLIDQ